MKTSGILASADDDEEETEEGEEEEEEEGSGSPSTELALKALSYAPRADKHMICTARHDEHNRETYQRALACSEWPFRGSVHAAAAH